MDLNSIKNRIDILELAEHLDIEVNSAHKARCPFHDDTDPSLTFWPDSNSFHCFGCNAGGDIFSLVMQKENLSFGDAVRYLCDF
ncbi:MAG: CHC2 zinc finger domain-containing protein, partial [Victivallaceae bacterium]